MVRFNQAVCLAAGCASMVPNATDPAPGPKIAFPTDATCGEVNVFYTRVCVRRKKPLNSLIEPNSGLAAYHPLVTSRGFYPVQADISLRNDPANLVKAGFNVYGRLGYSCRLSFNPLS